MACETCALVRRRDLGAAPPWDQIVRTPSWDVVHCYGTSIEGWLVLVARRHVATVAELSAAEAETLGPLIAEASRALHGVVGCEKTYVVQFAEHPDHPHVHVHVIPRPSDPTARGPSVFTRLGVPPELCVPDERMNAIAAAVRARLDG